MYRLRWRFDYSNRPPRYGVWNGASDLKSDMAAYQPKDGLVTATVEAKKDGVVKPIVVCPGHEFVMFQWNAVAYGPAVFSGTVKPLTRLLGIKLVTTKEEINICPTGKVYRAAAQKFKENLPTVGGI